MKRFLRLLILILLCAQGASAQSTVGYMTAPQKVCVDAYASVRAFRPDKDVVDDVTWSISVPGVATPVTINAAGVASDPAVFRYIGPAQQSLTVNLTKVGTYTLTANIYKSGYTTRVVTKQIIVEDCRMETCEGQFTPATNFKETFGSFPIGDNARRAVDPAVATIEYDFDGVANHELADNWYSIHWNSRDGGKQQWDYVEDHTADGRGGMLIANSSQEKKTFYRRLVTDLCPGARYNFSAWFINLNSREVLDNVCQNNPEGTNPYRYAGVTFIIRNSVTNAIIKQFNTNDVSMDLSRPDLPPDQSRLAGWQQFGGTVTLAGGQESVWVEIKNNNPGGCGNDIAIDDIEFKYCAPRIHSYIDFLDQTSSEVCPGAPLGLNCVITPAGYFTNPVYSWQVNKQDGNGWVVIPVTDPAYADANTSYLKILDGTLLENVTWQYRAMVIEAGNQASGKECYTPSNFVELKVLEMPKLTGAGRICHGDMTKLTVNYLRTPTQRGYETFEFSGPTYLADLVTPWPEAGAQPPNEIYVRPNATAVYTVTGTVHYGNFPGTTVPRVCKRTATAEVKVDERPVVNLGPDQRVCVNTPITLDAGASNAAFGIKWLPGNATTQTINITSPASGNTTQNYEVTVTNGVCVIKDNVNITSVQTIPAVILTTPTMCRPTATDFVLEATQQTGYTYTWEIVGDAHGASIVPNPADATKPLLTNMPFETDVRVRLTVTVDGTTCATTDEKVFRLSREVVATATSISQCGQDFIMNANTPHTADGQVGTWTIVSPATGVQIDPADINNPAAPVKLLGATATAQLTWTVRPPTGSSCTFRSVNVTLVGVLAPTMTALDVSRCLTPAGGSFSVPFTTTNAPSRYDLEVDPATPLSGFINRMNAVVAGSSFLIAYNNTATPGTYTFRLKARKTTSGQLCETVSTFNLTIFAPSTTPVISTSNVQVCRGGSAALTVSGTLGTGAEWVWYSGNCGGTGIEVGRGASISVTPAANTTYHVRAESTGPCPATTCASVTVSLVEPPSAANAGPDVEQCNNATFTLAAIAPTTGTGRWSGTLPAGASISDLNNRNATLTLPAGQSVTLTWTVSNAPCPPTTDEVTLTNLPAVTNNTISAAQTICPGATPAALTGTAPSGGNGGYTYQWQSSATGTAASFTNIAGATGAGYTPGALSATTYYRRTVTSGTCTHTSNVIAITVDVVPDYTIDSPIDACNASGKFEVKYAVIAGAPVRYDLIAIAPALPGFVNVIDGALPTSPITINYPPSTPAGTYNFRIIMRTAAGCATQKDFTVTLESLSTPAWIEFSPNRVCEGQTVTLTAKGGNLGSNADWVWYIDNCGNGTPIGTGDQLTRVITETTTFAVRAESNRACKNSDCATATITVDKMPAAPDAGPDQEHCNDAAFTLAGSTPSIAGATGTWTWSGALPAGASISNINDPAATVTLPAGNSLTLTWTITNGACTTNGDQVTLINRRSITNNIISAAQSICPNTTPTALTGTAPTGGNGTYTYQWQSSATNNAADFTDISGATGANYAPGALTTTTYYRRIVTSGTCSHNSNIIAITVSVTPVFTVQNVSAICNTVSSFNVTYTVAAGLPVQYDLKAVAPGMTGFTDITGATLTASPMAVTLPANVAAGTYTFTLTLRDAVGCESSQNFTVIVDMPSSAPTVSTTPVNICLGQSATLTVTGTLGTGAEWVWYTGSCGGTEVGRGASVSVTPATTTRYYVRAVSAGPCGNTVCATIDVNVFEAPPAAAAGPDQEHCNNATFTLAATAPAVGAGQWSGTLPAGASLSSLTAPNATLTLPAGQTVTLTWTVTNGPCAATTDAVTLTNLVALSNNIISAAQSICPNTTPTALTGTAPTGGNGTYTYQWQSSATNNAADFTNISGATGVNYAPGALTTTTYYRRIVTSGTCTHTSNIIAITVSVTPVFTVQNVAAICNTVTSFNVAYTVTAGLPVQYDLKTVAPGMTGFTDITGATLTASPIAITLPANVAAGTYTFTLTLRDAVGCESSQNFTVIVDMPSSAPTVSTTPVNICLGQSATLTVTGTLGTGAEWVWYTGSCGGTEVGRGASVNVTPTATTRYYVRAVTTGPCGNTVCATIDVNVSELPSAALAGPDQEHCDNATFTLAATAPAVGTGRWSGMLPAGATISDWNDRAATVTLPAGQTVTLTWTVTNGPCAATTDAVTLTNLVALGNNTISAAQSICPNTTPAALTGTVPTGGNGTYTYQWQSSATNNAADFTNISGATNANYAPGALTNTTYYRRIVTSGTCTHTSNIIAITVSVTPVFTAQNVAAICNTVTSFNVAYTVTAGLPVQYDLKAVAPGMTGFTDITGATLTASPMAITLPANVAAGTYTFTLTLRDAVGCESSQNFTVIVDMPSTPPTVDNTAMDICVGQTATLKVNGTLGTGAEWVWYTGSCGGTEVGRGASVNVTPTATTTYYVRAESTSPCGNTVCANITVNVFEHPSAALAGPDQEHCNNSTFTLAATIPAVGTGKWSGTLPAGASISDWNTSNATVIVPEGQTVTLTWTVTNGPCAATTDVVTLTNLLALDNNTISAAQSICPNTTPAALTGTVPTGGNNTYTYQWQSSPTANDADFTNIGGATGVNYSPGVLGSTTYYRRIVTSGECSSTSNIITITVSVTPVFTVQNVAAICNTVTSFNVAYAVTAGLPVQYDLKAAAPGMTGFTDITGANLTTSPMAVTLPANVAAGTYTFTLTLRDAVGCESSQNFTVIVDMPSTAPSVRTTPIDICLGETTTLNVTGTLGTGAEWVWYTGSCGGTEVGRGASINVTPTTTTTYYVRAESASPCGNTVCATIDVNVLEHPSAAQAGPDQDHCDDATFTLAATVPAIGTGKWSGTLPAGASISDDSDPSATVTLPAGQTATLTWTVSNGPCAVTTDEVVLINRKPIENNTIAADQVICPNADAAALTGSTPAEGNGTYTYKWESSTVSATGGFTEIPGATGISYDPGNIAVTTWFRRIVTSGPCRSISNMIQIRVTDAAPVVVTKGNDKVAECESGKDYTVLFDEPTFSHPDGFAITVTHTDATVTNPCGMVITRTWTAEDECGKTTSVSQSIEVKDTKAPVFNGTLPADATVECSNIPLAQVITASDDCSAATVTPSETREAIPGACVNNYKIIRMWTAKDVCGNTITHTQVLTVQDKTAPTFTLPTPADMTVECDAIPPFGDIPVTDNCSNTAGISIDKTQERKDGTCANSYTLTRTWTAKDECGNEAKVQQVITVTDTKAPVFTMPTPANITVECSNIPDQEDLKATDNCSPDDKVTVLKAETRHAIPGACANNYLLVRTWTAMDECKNTFTITQTITVADRTPPTFTTATPADVTVECDAVPAAPEMKATDLCSAADKVKVDYKQERIDAPGACANNYQLVRTWTATDECDNKTIVSQTITVRDTRAPAFTSAAPANVTVECHMVPQQPDLVATDNCSAAGNIRISKNEQRVDGNCANNYQLIRTWRAVDECGNETVLTQTITVTDNTKPAFTTTIPADATADCNNIPAAPAMEAGDNCSPATAIRIDFREQRIDIPGACANNYKLLRTWTATDECGNQTTAMQVITVVDRTAPTFTAAPPADVTVECNAIPAQPDMQATDNCSMPNMVRVVKGETRENIPGACVNNYRLIRTWTATDECGNSHTVKQVITVQDKTAPVFTLPVPVDATVECNAIPAQPDIQATDNCSAAAQVRIEKSETRENIPGACANNYRLIRKWTATDECGNSTTLTQVITVVDNTAPTFTMPIPADATVECNAIPAQPVLTATDNCSATNRITIVRNEVKETIPGACANNYRLIRSWTATDECGNKTTVQQTLTVVDNTRPTFTAAVPANATVECSAIPAQPDLSVTDNCTPSNLVRVVKNERREDIPGACVNNYRLVRTWTATDECGNTTTVQQTLTVVDRTAPVFTTTTPANATVECSAIPAQPGLAATDNCSGNNVTVVKAERRENIPGACVNNYRLIRTWTATDECGNSKTVEQVITVIDNTKPVFTTAAPANATVECSAIPAQPDLTASDNCSAANNIRIVKNETRENIPGVCMNNYRLIRTWTATDECGNSTTVQQVLTVQDKTPPVFTLLPPANLTVECDAIPPTPNMTATDNCSMNNVTIQYRQRKTYLSATCPNNYRLERIWTATDECGNSAVATQTITVTDNTAPVFTTPVPTDVTVDCKAIPAPVAMSATDNCDRANNVTVKHEQKRESIPGACANSYRLINTWTATDQCGNKAVIRQVITVQDTTRPVIAPAPADITINCGAPVPTAMVELAATDNCDATFPKKVRYTVDPFVKDLCNGYTIIRRWNVSDACGNAANEVVQRIFVQPCPKPELEPETLVNCSSNPFITLKTKGTVIRPTYTLVSVVPANAVQTPITSGSNRFNLNGATSATFIVRDGLTGCASDPVTYNITYQQMPVVDLGRDTSLCGGNGMVLDAGPANFGYTIKWSTGETTQRIRVTRAGTYKVTVSNGMCTATDEIKVGVIPMPLVNLPDTTICRGQNVKLDATVEGAAYLWSTGATSPSINVGTQETFWVRVTKNGCITIDTINVFVNPPPDISLTRDTSICPGQSVMLTVNTNAGRIQWGTGETGNSIVVSRAGNYAVAVYRDNCVVKEQITVRQRPDIKFELGPDRIICPGGSILVDARHPEAASYRWNDGDVDPVKSFTQSGTYVLGILDKYCDRYKADSIRVTVAGPPTINLGNDTTICRDIRFILRANAQNATSYRWSNGATTPSIEIREAGTYSVTVYNDCGSATDEITIGTRECNSRPEVPNVFSPNGDGKNDLFRPIVRGPMYGYELRIFNRWGELVFISKDMYQGWDGTYKGMPVDVGTFVWWLTYKKTNHGPSFVIKGDVTVVR